MDWLMLPVMRFRFEVDPPKAMEGEHEGKVHCRGRLRDLQTGTIVENAVRLRSTSSDSDKDRAALAYRLLRSWAEEKALDWLHIEHGSSGRQPDLCVRCANHDGGGHVAEPQPDCVICRGA